MRTTELRPAALALAIALMAGAGACGDGDDDAADGPTSPAATGAGGDIDPAELSPTVDHPYVAFALVRSAIYEGEETDPDTGETLALRVESAVREEPATVAGATVTVVEVSDYEDGELVEFTEDYYAQSPSGDVYYLGERVDEYEDGEVVGHSGQWLAGEGDNLPGTFMPADPTVGTEFEQERAPGVAEDRSTVVDTGLTVTVPAGTFNDCIKTEDYDPIGDVTEFKYYCDGIGLVKEEFAEGGSLELVEYEQ